MDQRARLCFGNVVESGFDDDVVLVTDRDSQPSGLAVGPPCNDRFSLLIVFANEPATIPSRLMVSCKNIVGSPSSDLHKAKTPNGSHSSLSASCASTFCWRSSAPAAANSLPCFECSHRRRPLCHWRRRFVGVLTMLLCCSCFSPSSGDSIRVGHYVHRISTASTFLIL